MKKFLFIFFLLCFTNFSSFGFSDSRILFVKGQVSVERDGEKITAVRNMSLQNNDVISTGTDSIAIVQIEKHSKMKLDHHSSLEVELSKDEIEKSNITFVNLVKGSFLMDFKRREKQNDEISVKVKTVSLGVRGTRFLVGTDGQANDQMTLAVERGLVDLYHHGNDDYEPVKAGHGMVVEKGNILTKPHPYDWMKNVNWNVDDSKSQSKFRGRELKRKRLAEFKAKRKDLIKRKKKKIRSQIKAKRKRFIEKRNKRLKKLKARMKTKRQRIKGKKREKVQTLMKKRNKKIKKQRRRRMKNQPKKIGEGNGPKPPPPKN